MPGEIMVRSTEYVFTQKFNWFLSSKSVKLVDTEVDGDITTDFLEI